MQTRIEEINMIHYWRRLRGNLCVRKLANSFEYSTMRFIALSPSPNKANRQLMVEAKYDTNTNTTSNNNLYFVHRIKIHQMLH